MANITQWYSKNHSCGPLREWSLFMAGGPWKGGDIEFECKQLEGLLKIFGGKDRTKNLGLTFYSFLLYKYLLVFKIAHLGFCIIPSIMRGETFCQSLCNKSTCDVGW